MTRGFKIIGWIAMTLLATLIGLVSLRYFFISPEIAGGEPLGQRFAEHIVPLLFHAGGGVLALLVGPWGFWGALRDKYTGLHRWMGRIYLVAVLVGGVAGLYMATMAFGGLPTRMGFIMLALLWLCTGGMAYRRIRRGDFVRHREWMIRNYALTFAAVTLRLWIPLFLAMGYGFLEAYATVAWLSWFPNLLIAELIIGNGKARRARERLTQAA
jgi:uncharacterized membrane protein